MAKAPSTDNYTLGKGVVYFNKIDQSTGGYLGERDLGNAPEFSFNIALEKLEHFSSRGGLRAKDKEVISQITPGCRFVLDEISKANLAMLTMATLNDVVQGAGVVSAEEVVAKVGMRTDFANRGVETYLLTYNDLAADNVLFVVGEVVSGATGVGEVLAVTGDASSGTLTIALTTAGFVAAEVLTGDIAGLADCLAVETLSTIPIVLVQDSADTITYVMGAEGVGNYQINPLLKDDEIGRILINEDQASPASPIADDDVLHVTYGHKAVNYTQIQAFNETIVEGKLRFVSDNPVGTQQELEIWRASLTPDGDTAMIGDDWSTLGFVAEILKDETNQQSPYLNITIVD